jgi:hypothetical protein
MTLIIVGKIEESDFHKVTCVNAAEYLVDLARYLDISMNLTDTLHQAFKDKGLVSDLRISYVLRKRSELTQLIHGLTFQEAIVLRDIIENSVVLAPVPVIPVDGVIWYSDRTDLAIKAQALLIDPKTR